MGTTAAQPINNPTGSGANARTVGNAALDAGALQQVMTAADQDGLFDEVIYTATLTAADTSSTGSTSAGGAVQGTPTAGSFIDCILPASSGVFQIQMTFSSASATTAVSFEATTYRPADAGARFFGIQLRRNGTSAGQTTEGNNSNASLGTEQAWLGLAAGRRRIRVRCTSLNGADTITIRVLVSRNTPGGVLLAALPSGKNIIGAVTDRLGSAASLGGAYGAGSDAVTTIALTTATAHAVFVNTAGAGGVSCYLDRIVFTHGLAPSASPVILRRFHGATFTVGVQSPLTTVSRQIGVSAASAAGRLYVSGTPGVTGLSGGTLVKAVHVTSAGEEVNENGGIVVPPGGVVHWTYQLPTASATSLAHEVVWDEAA